MWVSVEHEKQACIAKPFWLGNQMVQNTLTSLGSLLRHIATNSLNALLKFPVSSGGLFFGIKNKTLMGWRSELGGSPFASSIAVIPKDQMSAYKKIYFFNINLLTPISDKHVTSSYHIQTLPNK